MTIFTKPLLAVDTVRNAAPSSVSVGLELQSTTSAFLVSRLTNAQIAALTPVNGMIVYNTDTAEFSLYQNGGWANFSPNATQTTTVAVSSAQLLAMNGAPVVILPAPGAGKAIIVTNFIFEYVYGTTAYQNGGQVQLNYTGQALQASAGLSAANTLLQGASCVTSGIGPTAARPNAQIANTGISLTNGTAPFIAGDGTANVTVLYTTLTL